MATNTLTDLITFNHLEAVLKEYGQIIQDKYKQTLLKDDKKASGALIQSIQYTYSKEGNNYYISLNLTEYWKYVEYGRKAGKFPPVNKILEWIKVKPVLPHPDKNGKLPTENQLAFLISRSIAENGIEAGYQLNDTIDDLNSQFTVRLIQALDKDLSESMDILLLLVYGE